MVEFLLTRLASPLTGAILGELGGEYFKMNQSVRKSIVVFVTAFILTVVFTPLASHADTWHKGTPTALRGNWKSNAKTESTASGKEIVYYTLSFSKTAVGNSATINGKTLQFRLHAVDYQKISKQTYLIRTLFTDNQTAILTVKQTSKKKIVVGNGTDNTNKKSYYKMDK